MSLDSRRASYLEISDAMAASWACVARRRVEAAELPTDWLVLPKPRSIVCCFVVVVVVALHQQYWAGSGSVRWLL